MRFLLALVLAFVCSMGAAIAAPPSPAEFLGFTPGTDRTLADYRQISRYFKALDAASPRVELQVLGPTTLGEEMIMAVISSETNMKNLPRIKEIARRLADPRGLTQPEAEALVREGKAIILVTCSIHASEIGASQMAMEWAHALATAEDEETKRRLENVVLLLVPSLNPDGLMMETEWYRKNLGTRYEGSRMPWLYHHYVGHDNNRDWFMLTQKETRALSRAVYREWFPQVWLDEHQMGWAGPRIFVPPYAEPVDKDIHPLVWREANLIGATMALRLEQREKSGVIYGFTFDAYWPGGTKNTAWWKNITGLLTEVASCRLATPVRVEPGELAGRGKGLVEYGPQTNFPNPWPGGEWRLRDIMDYERIVSDALLETASNHRADFLGNALSRARASTKTFAETGSYRIPALQRDPVAAHKLASLMLEHGVEVKAAPNGDVFIPLAQPYGRFVAEMFEAQRFPEVKLVAGTEAVRPYDVSAWTLPMMTGVTVERTTLPPGLSAYQLPAARPSSEGAAVALLPGGPENARLVNAALRSAGRVRIARGETGFEGERWPAGTYFLDSVAAKAAAAQLQAGQTWRALKGLPEGAEKVSAPRVGLYKPWMASMDEGWTRFVLDEYGFGPKTLDNKTIRAGKLGSSLDALVLADIGKDVISQGKPKREEGEMRYGLEFPPEYSGGLEKEGAKALVEFVEGGGTLVAMGASTEYVLEEFNLPVRNALAKVSATEFQVPGSLLRARVTPGHPVTYGQPSELPLFVDHSIAFETTLPGAEMERWVLASYPADARDILMSGWIRGESRLSRKAAAVAVTYGKGKIVLLGFRPQHRAQTPVTYPFLFNAIYWSTAGAGGSSR
ncbi:MAG: M14 family metallopeptidase [Thermoanaerobaculia bacterium]|nr:M14 family metallopeptidase [Thermoanaerobaculia bacterium]